jgi:hypothetical protein
MKGPQAVSNSLSSAQYILSMLVADLSDADFLVRPVPGANHIAWQIGHLIVSEQGLAKDSLVGVQYPALPPGFAEQHASEKATVDPPKGFKTKAEYMDLFNKTRLATIAAMRPMRAGHPR